MEKSTGLKPNRDALRQVEKRAKEIVAEYENLQAVQKEAAVPQAQPVLAANGVLFVDFLLDWLERQKTSIANTTYVNYVNMVKKHIAPYFSDLGLMITEVKPMHLQRLHKSKGNGNFS